MIFRYMIKVPLVEKDQDSQNLQKKYVNPLELPEFLHKLVIQCDLMLKITIDKNCLLKRLLYKQLNVLIEHSMTSTVDVGKSM